MNDKIRHHLNDDILFAYSAGALPEAFSLMVATHVSLCDQCRAQVMAFDSVGGAMLEDSSVALETGSLDAVLQSLGTPDPAPRAGAKPATATLPKPLQDYIGGDLDAVKWRAIGMGVKQAILPTAKGAMARLLFIPAGAAVPDHGHKGTEMTLVLKGAFSDEIDSFGPGDVETADQSVTHTPIADIGEDCICLAVTDAPLKFNSLIPRLMQPLLRI